MDLQERLNHVERQLKLKTSEAARHKKKTHELEQALREAESAQKSKAESGLLAAAIDKTQNATHDERRLTLLKAQNV